MSGRAQYPVSILGLLGKDGGEYPARDDVRQADRQGEGLPSTGQPDHFMTVVVKGNPRPTKVIRLH